MELKLKDKVALVTGASRGLGYAVALGLAREGCRLAINSREEARISAAAEKLRQETGAEVLALAGDVTNPEVPISLVEATVRAFGGLDLLVTNAGGPPPGTFESFDDATWQKAIDLSLMSHVRLIRAALPYLRQSKAASVLTVTSYSVKQPIPNLVLSNSIRAATVGLTKSLALELGREGIRFNSILPAWTETERVLELMAFRARQNGTTVEEEIARQAKDSPLGRMGTPEEFANAAVFLLSPAASYITGVMLTVDGGMYKGTL
ncbi:MAG: SDR family oxidoreductase [Anaerolineales bacterium]|nr:SDR family oxidoreductase [Anaerolineales bacterium]MCX7608210.1 SDR family oxidoreductase [Anaerolineales bacterium]MDW8227031.1 SDR family oxidoreductase [Anaerolineales bacterium]